MARRRRNAARGEVSTASVDVDQQLVDGGADPVAVDVDQQLVDAGADPVAVDVDQQLVDAGADPDSEAAGVAVDVDQVLVDAGADPDSEAANLEAPLHYCSGLRCPGLRWPPSPSIPHPNTCLEHRIEWPGVASYPKDRP